MPALLLVLMTASSTSQEVVIVALGDSTTAGTPLFKSPIEAPPDGAGDPESQFAHWLMRDHPNWKVLNRGVNGERSDEIAGRFDRDVIAHRPRLVVIIAGVNDVYQGRPVSHVTTQLRRMYDRARAAGIPVIAGSIVPYNTATADQNARMREINAWIAGEAARDANVTFVDTRKAAAAAGDPDRLSGSPDGLHPDVAGYRRMAAVLAPAIVNRLAGKVADAFIVFDLDGTLVDSRQDLATSTNEMLETYGAPALPIDDVAAMVGDGAKVLVERALAAVGLDPHEPDALARFRAIYDRRLIETTHPYEGIAEVVTRAASRASLAVLSNKPEMPTRRLLETFDLARHFRWIVGGDASFPRKPDPAGLNFLMTQAEAAAHRTLLVGDSRIDAETAQRAGARFCFARYGFGRLRGDVATDRRDFVADTPADVGRALETFLRRSD